MFSTCWNLATLVFKVHSFTDGAHTFTDVFLPHVFKPVFESHTRLSSRLARPAKSYCPWITNMKYCSLQPELMYLLVVKLLSYEAFSARCQ